MSKIEWTNPSVLKLAGDSEPFNIIIEKTRKIILKEMDKGWNGPPFDPFYLAKRLGIDVIPREDVLDARLLVKSGKIEIEYNPNMSKSRIRFSIAHEIAHTFFPDYKESVHHRRGKDKRNDDWQLELLCNVSAAEILMPVGPNFDRKNFPITIDKAIEIHDKFDVSIEAALLRLCKLTERPVIMFAASRETDDRNSDFRIDYTVNSPTSIRVYLTGKKIPSTSMLSECSAIGYTTKKREKWFDSLPELSIECIGVYPYPNNIHPRVIGILKTEKAEHIQPTIRYLVGDATDPKGTGQKIIAHIANDKSANLGRGFGYAITQKWPNITYAIKQWMAEQEGGLELGKYHLVKVTEDISVFTMIAQHGFGPSRNPRIRYHALSNCLFALSEIAKKSSASVHMPRIGTGYAGGNWDIISELINETLIQDGIEVTVYDLHGKRNPNPNIRRNLLDFLNPLA